jgi:RNA-directed DNA polymerase
MKRTGNLFAAVHGRENLALAFAKAAKGKQNRPDVIQFRQHYEANILKLQNDLKSKRLDIGHYRFFTVRDPKTRQICAASFPERVLHHAVMNLCEPVLDAYAIGDSYACRKGKGNRRALERAAYFTRRHDWYLKLDIRKYFDSIDQAIVMALLGRRFKDYDVLALFKHILDSYHTLPGKGLPIGNLISQHLANFYLAGFDHWIKEERRIAGYIRYMDDFILYASSKAILANELQVVTQYLENHLALTLKDNVQLNRCCVGVPFLGFRVFPTHIRLLPESKKRFSKKFRRYERDYCDGLMTQAELIRHLEPLFEFTRAGDSLSFRRLILEKFGVLS